MGKIWVKENWIWRSCYRQGHCYRHMPGDDTVPFSRHAGRATCCLPGMPGEQTASFPAVSVPGTIMCGFPAYNIYPACVSLPGMCILAWLYYKYSSVIETYGYTQALNGSKLKWFAMIRQIMLKYTFSCLVDDCFTTHYLYLWYVLIRPYLINSYCKLIQPHLIRMWINFISQFQVMSFT